MRPIRIGVMLSCLATAIAVDAQQPSQVGAQGARLVVAQPPAVPGPAVLSGQRGGPAGAGLCR